MHRSRSSLFALTALCGLLVASPAHADPIHLDLNDGTAIDGELLEVSVGVLVRVRVADGSAREVRWPELRVVPGALGTELHVSAGPEGDDPSLWTTPREGATATFVVSEGDPIVLTVPNRAPLCSTPCVLHLPPGTSTFRAGGRSLREEMISLVVDGTPTHVVLHAPPQRISTAAAIMVIVAGGVVTTGSVLIAALETSLFTRTSPLDSPLFWTGIGLGVAGTAFTAAGIVLAIPTRGGVAQRTPLAVHLSPLGVSVTGVF